MRKFGKVDSNHGEIVEGLRRVGATVQSIASVGGGCPDIVVGFRRRNYLFEIKPSDKSHLTEDEADWHRDWLGMVDGIYCLEDALHIIGFR